MTEQRPILTPCRKVCVIDPLSRLCEGCGRTLQEIGRWLSFSPAEREALMRALPARLEALHQSARDRRRTA